MAILIVRIISQECVQYVNEQYANQSTAETFYFNTKFNHQVSTLQTAFSLFKY